MVRRMARRTGESGRGLRASPSAGLLACAIALGGGSGVAHAQDTRDRDSSVALPSPASPTSPPLAAVPGTPLVETLDLDRVLRGEGQGLTADEVARAAVSSAPGLAQGRAQLAQARSGAAQAYLAFFPRLDLTARYTRLSPITQGTLAGGSIGPDEEQALRDLITNVPDPSSQALFNINLESQLALANFSFPVLLDSFSFGAELQYPVSDVFFQVLPLYEGAERAVDAQ